MDFTPEQLQTLHDMLTRVNVTDEHLSRGVQLTSKGTEIVAKRFGIQVSQVPEMLKAVSALVAKDLSEDSDRFSFEADYMGNLTLRDNDTGEDRFLQGHEAFELADNLTSNPDKQQVLISQYFDSEPLTESMTMPVNQTGGTFNFPYKGKFATARFGIDEKGKFKLSVISLRDSEDNEETISPELQVTLDAVAMTWVDKV